MASGGSDRDAKDALSKFLQMGTVAEYESKFVILANRVTGISENLLKSFYISGLKPTLQCALLRSNPTTLGEAFSLARAMKARFVEDALSKLLQMGTVAEYQNEPTTLVEAFSLARMTEARFEDERTTTTIVNPNDLNIAIPDQVLEESILHVSDKVEITSDNDARDQASEVETKVLMDDKQDDAKVVKVVGVAIEKNNNDPNVLEGNEVIGVGENDINKCVDKEVQYSFSTLHVLISLLKRLNDKHIKKKNMKAEIQRRIWNPGIKIFLDNTLSARSNPITLGEVFSLARATEARLTEARLAKDALSMLLQMGGVTDRTVEGKAYHFSRSLLLSPYDQVLEESILHTSNKVEITSDNDARDQASEVETKVLVDGKQDDTKVVKVVGAAVEQKNDEPNVLEGNGVIDVGENEINKWVDKEIQYSVFTLHVLIPTLVDTESKLGADGDTGSGPTLYRSLAVVLQCLTFTCLDISSALQQLSAYADAAWAGFPVTRRSTFGYYVFLGDNLLSWSAKRQVTLSRSSAETEYRGVANVVAETGWVCNLLRELRAPLFTATLIYCDNVSVFYMSTNPVQHQCTKHIEIDIHFIRDFVASGQVRVLHVPSRKKYVGIFTKGLPSALFLGFRSSLNI
ncbi:ribonuclease H-like domain-containing protein [Tanacetum coccineum]